jgi:hypothetical protein
VAGFDRALGQAQEPAWVPLTDVDPLRIALAWRDGERSPLVPAFADVVRESAGDLNPAAAAP